MKFLDSDFLLYSEPARRLYHEYAQGLPIFDYHCHLPVQQIADNARFENLTRIWLAGDHYKWRAMRAQGVDERLITGPAGDYEKFEAWAATVPYTIRNPLYHWTHMELRDPFGIENLLSPDTAKEIYQQGTEFLQTDDFRARALMEHFRVKVVCTTDDPVDTLEHHERIRRDGFAVKVLPAFRPDRALAADFPAEFNAWVDRLEERTDQAVNDFSDFIEAIDKRHAFFHEMGCRLSDHGLEQPYTADYSEKEIAALFDTLRSGKALEAGEVLKFKSCVLYHLAVLDSKRNWTQQFHFGALRNNNRRMFAAVGSDSGFDAIGDFELARSLVRFLDRLDTEGRLTRTIVYVLNPRDNALVASILGSFQDGTEPGKMQFGSAWWYNDTRDGMEAQINTLSSIGLLSRFVGMLTDSRSFLSYPRHDYFRRILCNLIGQDVDRGELPGDLEHLGSIVQDICFDNAVRYFGIEVPADQG